MNIDRITTHCADYFAAPQRLAADNYSSTTEKVVDFIKTFSFATVVIPFVIGAIWFACSMISHSSVPVPVRTRPAPVRTRTAQTSRQTSRPARQSSRRTAPVRRPVLIHAAARCSVRFDDSVLTERLSDHSIMSFFTETGPVLSSNVMCCGERFNPNECNSFLINPLHTNGRRERFDALTSRLQENAERAHRQTGALPVIALQEFPRTQGTGCDELSRMLQRKFPSHRMYFGEKDASTDRNSQMCLLIPVEGSEDVRRIHTRNPRIQAVKVGQVAYVNIHPASPSRNTAPDEDSVIRELTELRDRLVSEENCQHVHIMGDWNRRRGALPAAWRNGLNTPPHGAQSHLPPHRFAGSTPSPIDHHILWRGSQ